MNLEAKKNIDEISSQFECLKKSKVEFMKLNDEKLQFHSGNLILLLVAVIIINGSTIYYSITQNKNTAEGTQHILSCVYFFWFTTDFDLHNITT